MLDVVTTTCAPSCDICAGVRAHARWCPEAPTRRLVAREVPVGVLPRDGVLLYPHVKWSSTDRVLSGADWRWDEGAGAWVGAGEPPVPFTRGRAS